MVLDQVTQVYFSRFFTDAPPIVAVNDTTIGIKAKECLGILSLGGAGRTTICRLIAEGIPPSFGDFIDILIH